MIILIQFLLPIFFSTFLYSYEKSDARSGCFIHDSQDFNNQQYQHDQSGQDTGFYAEIGGRSSFGTMTAQEYEQMRRQAIISELVCQELFHMSIAQKEQMKSLNYDNFVSALLRRDDLSDQAILALWDEYEEKRWWNWSNEKEDNETLIKDGLAQRKKDREAEVRLKEQQERDAQQEIIKQKKAQEAYEQYEKDYIIQEHQYLADIYDDLSFQSSGDHGASESRVIVRQQALQKTKTDDFIQYDQQYSLTPQAQAYARLQDFDVRDYQNFYGTALQQQFHQESCDVFEQAATLQKDLPYKSNLLFSGMLCADAAHEMNHQENIKSVMSLTDLGFALLDVAKQYGQAVCKGVLSSGTDFVHGLLHPDEMIASVGNALYFVIETAALNCYSEEYGFEDLYIPLRDQRNAQIIEGLKTLGSAIVNSTGPQIVEALTRFGADFFVPGKILKAVGATLGVLRSQVPVVRSVETVVAVAGDSLGVQEVTCDVAKIAAKMEVVAQKNIAQKTAKKLSNAEKQFEKSAKRAAKKKLGQKGDAPPAVDTRSLLDKNLRIAEDAKLDAVRIEKLSDGRIRYYEAETASSTPGPTRGSAYVTEYDPVRGVVRTWYESRTHAGLVNRVHPKTINGKNIKSLHYPHTKAELEAIAQQIKGKK